jgi:hypothetical protein
MSLKVFAKLQANYDFCLRKLKLKIIKYLWLGEEDEKCERMGFWSNIEKSINFKLK